MNQRCIVGVDIGSFTIKAFAATVGSDANIVIKGCGLAPTAGYTKGHIVDTGVLAGAIKEALDCLALVVDLPLNAVYLGIGGSALQTNNAVGSVAPAFPNAVCHEDITRACRAAVLTSIGDDQEVLHALPASFLADGRKIAALPLGQPANRLDVDVHIVTAPRSLITEIKTALATKGINIAGVVANSVVGAQSLAPKTSEFRSLIMDIGAGTVDMALCRQGQVQWSASLPVGGDYITADIMYGLNVTKPHAEDIKRYYSKLDEGLLGLNIILNCACEPQNLPVPYDFLHTIVECRVEEIVSIAYNHVNKVLTSDDIEEIYLTGGCAQMPSMANCIRRIFKKPVKVAQISQLPAEYAGPTNTVSFGLLQYAARYAAVTDEPQALGWRSMVKRLANYFRPSR